MRYLVALFALLLFLGCQGSGTAPTAPPDLEGQTPGLIGDPLADPFDEIFREGAGLVQGDITVRGTTETSPDWDDHPFPVSQAARSGDLAVFRVRGRLTNNANTTLFCKLSQATKNYPSYFIPGTNTDTYRAIYVENNEPMNLTFYNSSNWNTAQNSKAAIYNYSFKTSAVENADEPNDDDNGATITDRTLAKNIPKDFVATRSVYYFNETTRDIEEWYRTDVTAGNRFSWKFATSPGRYGSTWSYELKVFDPSGVQMGSAVPVSSTSSAATITRTATTTGIHYLQIVATPLTKSYTNLFYALYTITPCLAPTITGVSTIAEYGYCPGGIASFQGSYINPVTSYSWNFGGGATPNTSTQQKPEVVLGSPGTYTYSLTVSNGCTSSETFQGQYSVACTGNVGRMGGVGASVITTGLKGFDDGGVLQVGYFTGTVDLDPGPGTSSASATGQAGFMSEYNNDGSLFLTRIIGGGAGTAVSPRSVDFHPVDGYRVAGAYTGLIDFDPGAGVTQRNSTTDGANFVLALDTSRNFKWVATFGSGVSGIHLRFHESTGSLFVAGSYGGTVDMDPGLGVLTKTASGIYDGYLMTLSRDGLLQYLGIFSGTGWDAVSALDVWNDTLYLTGIFNDTVDFDPGPGVSTLTSLGSIAGFVARFAVPTPSQPFFASAGALTGVASNVSPTSVAFITTGVHAGKPVFTGGFDGSPDFDPGVGTKVLSSNGGLDSYVLGLTLVGGYSWVAQFGGESYDTAFKVAIHPDGSSLRVAGTWSSTVDFDPGPAVDNRVSFGNDAYLVSFTTAGDWLWSSTWQDTGSLQATQVGIDNLGISRVSGTFTGTADFDPGVTVFNLTPLGETDSYNTKILSNGLWQQ
ncbi:MAG: hypothetical protein GEEBNDBF_00198 [bacterium]|nr:hypothetical protein [bacterium]